MLTFTFYFKDHSICSELIVCKVHTENRQEIFKKLTFDVTHEILDDSTGPILFKNSK